MMSCALADPRSHTDEELAGLITKTLRATGTGISQCRRRHRHQEFLASLHYLDASVPRDLDIHLMTREFHLGGWG
jgi:hypothetical protein